MALRFFIILSTLLFHSCEKKVVSKEECEQLSMKSYRGLPKEAKLFKDYCQDKKLVYTKELCQKALGDLALYGNQEYLLKKYGRLIMGCFNKADLQRFLKNQKNRGEQR